jgi:hypothetical protein
MRLGLGRRRRRRLLALVAFRDEMRFLPGLFENLAPQVDGVIALDDQSTDGSAEYVASQPLIAELLAVPPGAQGEIDDSRNQRRLTEAAWSHGADWLLGIDPDERVEREFRARAERAIDRAERLRRDALWVHFRELWDSPDRFRSDGVWGLKRKACLFRCSTDHQFDDRRLHSFWAPPTPPEGWPQANLYLYHLRMIRAEDRQARFERYARLDPEAKYQEIGYEYLVDDDGIELSTFEPGRDYVPLGG